MRLVARLLAAFFMLASVVVLVLEIVVWRATGSFGLRPLGQLWYQIDRGSLNLVQAVIERYLWPPLWEGVVAVLRLPAAPTLLVVGAALFWLTRLRYAPPIHRHH
jgi:predicted anti-sigma-YlaC factor YlaD